MADDQHKDRPSEGPDVGRGEKIDADGAKVTFAKDWLRKATDRVQALALGEPRPSGNRPRIGLALAGGFARGIAHIGVIREIGRAHV